MTKSVGVHEAKTQLSKLLDDVAGGEEVVITNRGVPVARLVGTGVRERRFGVDRGLVAMSDDFDAPLPDELRHAFGA